MVCANEGVLRDALDDIGNPRIAECLEQALRHGAGRVDGVTIVNVNRQRPTADGLWRQLIEYVAREELWWAAKTARTNSGGCPMRSNAEQLRARAVAEQLRTLVRLATGEAVPTLREVLAILSWAIVGDHTCRRVKDDNRDLGHSGFTAAAGYFTRLLGGGLTAAAAERSPLLAGMRRSGLGEVSDLEVEQLAAGHQRRTARDPGDCRATQ